MPRIIEVIVAPNGDVSVQTRGYAGGDCLQASRFLEEALGVLASERKTSEFYTTAENEQHLQQQ